MLADQEVEVIEKVIGKGRRMQNLIYIHRQCAYDMFSDLDDAIREHIDLFSWQPPSHFFKNARTAFWLFAPLFSFDCFQLYSLLDFRKYSRKRSIFFRFSCEKSRFFSSIYISCLKLTQKLSQKQRLRYWQPYIAQYP